MLKSTLLLQIVLILFASACSNKVETGNDINSKEGDAKVCTLDGLERRSNKFLGHLVEGDASKAIRFYSSQYRDVGRGHGIYYTFFPQKDSNAVFDIISKNEEEAFQIKLLGQYEDGELVGFFQNSAAKHSKNINYLSENQWKTFFVCNFVCNDGVWEVSDYTCFEDSGSPFE